MKIKVGLLLVACILLCAAPAQADSVLLNTSSSVPSCNYCGWDLNTSHWHALSFTFANTFTNVSITLPLSIYPAPYGGTAWITNSIGPGTTAANIVATSTFSNVNNNDFYVGPVTFFSGLTLGPGTYYFMVSVSSGGAMVEGLHPNYNLVVSTAPGVSAGSDYVALDPNYYGCCAQDMTFPPASNWTYPGNAGDYIPMTITGVSAVPEPGTLLLVATGVIGVWLRRRAA